MSHVKRSVAVMLTSFLIALVAAVWSAPSARGDDLQADLSVSTEDVTDPSSVGGSLAYIITVTNAGPDLNEDVVLTNTLAAEVTWVSSTTSQGSCEDAVAHVVVCNLGSIDITETETIEIGVTPDVAGTVVNTAVVGSGSMGVPDPDGSNNTDVESTEVYAEGADYSIFKADSPDPVGVGEELTYTLTIASVDTGTPFMVEDVLPPGVEFVSATAHEVGNCWEESGVVTCSLEGIPEEGSLTIEIVVVPTVAGTIVNSASVIPTYGDPDPANDSDEEATEVGSPGGGPAVVEVDESVGIQDGFELDIPVMVEVDETAAVGDDLDTDLPAVVQLHESVGVDDGLRLDLPAIVRVDEALGVEDGLRFGLPAVIDLDESLRVDDTLEATLPAIVDVIEAVTVEDEPDVLLPAMVDVDESFQVHDEPTVVLPAVVHVSLDLGVVDTTQVSPPVVVDVSVSFDVEDAARFSRPMSTCPGHPDATIVGTSSPDHLTGTARPDIVCLLGGNDVFLGLAGDDVVFAGPGADLVNGGPGRDLIDGSLGDDRLFGGPGNDVLEGMQGNDTLLGQQGRDTMRGGAGIDTCDGVPRFESVTSCENRSVPRPLSPMALNSGDDPGGGRKGSRKGKRPRRR
jgi:uncharacterized repeat protein (TIGR01451 family)